MASLMPKKNQLTLADLLTLDRNSDALLKYGLQLDEKFAIKRGLLRASAQWGSYKVDIFCGDEDKDNPEDRSLQVYKSLINKSFMQKVKYPESANYMRRLEGSFPVDGGVCRYTLKCTRTLERGLILGKFPNEVDYKPSQLLIHIGKAMSYLSLYGWLYKPTLQNVCIDRDQLSFIDFRNVDPIPRTKDTLGNIKYDPGALELMDKHLAEIDLQIRKLYSIAKQQGWIK